jgi:hypothetical protein
VGFHFAPPGLAFVSLNFGDPVLLIMIYSTLSAPT